MRQRTVRGRSTAGSRERDARPTTDWIPFAPVDCMLLIALLCSGAAAVGLEVIWLRIVGLALGAESFGMLGVLAGFFAGLAIGSAALHARVVRTPRPIGLYVGAELAITMYALASPWFMPALTQFIPRLLGPWVGANQSLAALILDVVVAGAVLVPATFCMGITTVAAVQALRRVRGAFVRDRSVAFAYAANTAGATIGVLACTYGLLPRFGTTVGSSALAALSLLAAALAFTWQRRRAPARIEEQAAARPPAGDLELATRAITSVRAGYGLLFCTGAAGIGVETVGTYVLAEVFENTVHTFADILAVYLLGTALGARVYASNRMQRRIRSPAEGTTVLLFALTCTGLLCATVLRFAPQLLGILAPTGASYVARIAAEAFVAAMAFLPVTVFMGATYSHVMGAYTAHGIGYASAWNTLGAAIAPFVFGLLLVPAFGYGVAFFAAISVYAFCFVHHAIVRGHHRLTPGIAGLVFGGALAFSPLVLVRFPPGIQVLAQRTGLYGVVSVWEDSQPGLDGLRRALQVDQRQVMGGLPGFVTARMGHLAMLLGNEPREVLFLGVGTGLTAGAALDYDVAHVTGVELVPEMLDMLHWFAPENNELRRDHRVTLFASDARRFVRGTDRRFDAIVADLYHPSRDGSASLYTIEHFRAIRDRLNERGVFVQWLPLNQLRTEDLRTIMRTFLEVYPHAHAVLGNYSDNARLALVGWRTRGAGAPRPGLDITTVERVLEHRTGPQVFDGLRDVLASYMFDAPTMRRFAGDAPLNTDVNQRFAYDAASAAVLGESGHAHESLRAVLAFRQPFPDDFVILPAGESVPALRKRVGPYGDAVSHYMRAEVARLDIPVAWPAAAVDEYLAAYRAEPAFTLAIGRLIELAIREPGQSRALVEQLLAITPNQPELLRLSDRLAATDTTEGTRALLAHFLETGGD